MSRRSRRKRRDLEKLRRATFFLATILLTTILLTTQGCDFPFSGRSSSRSSSGRSEEDRTEKVQGIRIEPTVARQVSRREIELDRARSSVRLAPAPTPPPPRRTEPPRPSSASRPWQITEWEPRFAGVDQARFSTMRPRRMKGVALRIDLEQPGIEFFSTPSNGARPQETDGLKTSSFLQKYGCQAAINAAPFSPIWGQENRPQDIKGLAISRGELVSRSTRYPALLISRDNKARVSGPPFDLDGVYTAVCGFDLALKDGEVVRGSNTTHPRVGAGVSKDGRYLYLMVIDGRQYHHSIGATRPELGQWLRRVGAWDGLNLDGGGTTTMCVADARGRAIVVNSPIHNGRPGNERISGSHLGVKARPLDDE